MSFLKKNHVLTCTLVFLALGCGGTSKELAKMKADAEELPTEPPLEPVQGAAIGEQAPPFKLMDLDGREVELASFKGKIVVLEWFNPACPFVKTAHEREFSLKNVADGYSEKGVIWLAIASQGPGEVGHGKEKTKTGRDKFGITYPILMDGDGKVGKMYGAKKTPHMFVINSEGVVVFNGGIDNTMGGDLEDADPPPAVNYVKSALDSLLNGEDVAVSTSEPWG